VPAAESVLQIPLALAVSHQDYFVDGGHCAFVYVFDNNFWVLI
jgi:hypothetical protein